MSWEFDYARFWRDAVAPDWRDLPLELRSVVKEIAVRCADERQNSDCDMDWPAWPELKAFLYGLSKSVLGKSIAVVHAYGHNMPAKQADAWIQETGAYWKYEAYAKRAWRELYPGASYPVVYGEDFIKPGFYSHVEGTDFCNEELTELYRPRVASLFTVHAVDNVNHRPHPFMIGPQHFPKDGGMYLDPDQAPCAMSGCNLSYKEHTSDKVLFLELVRNCTNKEAHKVLKSIVDVMKADKIDGVAFIDNDNGFRIGDK